MRRIEHTICYVTLLISIASAAVPAIAATKVFLLAGQSNMAGVGGYPGEPGYPADEPCPALCKEPQPAVRFWNYGRPQPAKGINQPSTGNGWVDLQPGFGHTVDEFGPELSFGHRLHQLFTEDDINRLVSEANRICKARKRE